MRISLFFHGVVAGLSISTAAMALSVSDAITYVLESNPDIQAAEFNKQAVEFELERARAFRAPKFSLDGWTGTSRDIGETTNGTGGYIQGYELSASISQRLFDGYWTRSEIERQAYRVDAAALRVLERSEFLALEAVRVFADVRRMRAQVSLARSNIAYHRTAVSRLQKAFDNGVVGPSDLLQAEERLLVAQDILLQFELDQADTEAMFLEVVGIAPQSLSPVRSIAASVPGSLDLALATARRHNPTIKFSQADVGAADAMARRAKHNLFPSLDLVLEGRYGDDLNGIDGRVNDVSLGIRLTYELQGGAQRAQREEQARRVHESRARLLSQTRLVEREMRHSWNSMVQIHRRVGLLENQVSELQELRDTYEKEFIVGARSLLDVLNTQNALVRAQAELINARSLSVYVEYRVLAASGTLLSSLGIEPPEDAKPYARDQAGAPPVSSAEPNQHFDAKSFSNWRRNVSKKNRPKPV